MDKELKDELRGEIQAFYEQTKRFINKELSVKDFKGYSGGFGSYAQRGGKAFMLRLRMDQGVMTKEKLKFICDICKKHGVTKTHLTTCQTIQLHDLTGMEIPYIMTSALDHGIVCRGGGGDFPRNVMCSPLSGVDQNEYFDVLPYASKVGEYLLSIINKYTLPRKLKIAFSSSDVNETHATFRDLGFCANADHTFDVYCAGGLGNNPRMGLKVGHHISCEDVLFYVSTMVLMFMEFGNYENRGKARTRYMQETLGEERLIEEFQKKVTRAMAGEKLKIQAVKRLYQKNGSLKQHANGRVIAQKQSGLYAVSYHPIGGNMAPAKLLELYECIKDMEDVELRITPQQGAYIINLCGDEVDAVLRITEDGACNEFEESTACIGASTCQVGLRDSQGMLKEAIMYLREKNYANHTLPKIFISGCPSSCGTNQIGVLGFQGTVKVIERKPYPAFNLSIKGNDERASARFGEVHGAILEDDVCRFLEAIGDAVTKHNSNFTTWLHTYEDEFQGILQAFLK